MKRNLLILVIILLIGFIVNSCGDDEKKSSCECNPKQHNEGESCCNGNGCNCIIILNCICPADTLHLISENCRGPLNCECDLNVVGVRASNGIAITNRQNVANFNDMVDEVNSALAHTMLSTTQKAYIKNNIKEIRIIPSTTVSNDAIVEDDILIINSNVLRFSIMLSLKQWCESNNIY